VITQDESSSQRRKTALRACIGMAAILLVFTAAGTYIFELFGITLSAFRIAGGFILWLVALDMLRAQRSTQEGREELVEGQAKQEVALTPLAIPILAGPGAISTVIVLHGQARGLAQQIALCGCILAVCLASYLILRLSARGMKWLSPIALRITTRVMGLLLAAIAFQFALNAIAALRGTVF